ncbi:MAG TPA: proline--tRNA ligase, partial [Firmicutes bacterium]|nr:proline--tRNA ligase [Bacillota bacterium]
MRMSTLYVPTLREVPAEAETISHQLLLRAGLIRKAMSGVYAYLPLGWRVIHKIERIVREEMDRAGGQELLLPIAQPAEIWQESGRWEVYGEEMFKLKDRHGREMCLGPTHEEMITALVRDELRSYRQLPVLLYQIQNKYRDEIRPRFGLMRGREFIMKDLYSFDRDEAGLAESYQRMLEAYARAFTRCGLETVSVEADPGAIGGTGSHEFMVLAETGEAAIVSCGACGYAANVEKAECPPPAEEAGEPPGAGPRPVSTPGLKTIAEVAAFLRVMPAGLIKTLFFAVGEELVAVLLRGDHQVNEFKLDRLTAPQHCRLAEPEEVARRLGLPVGFVGPVGLSERGVEVWADQAVMAMGQGIAGANRPDTHLVGVRPGVDFVADRVLDLRLAEEGDPCPRCGAPLRGFRGIEVGHCFKLGTKYSKPLGATYLDESGAERPLVMGSYGIGIGRTAAAAIEQHHDADGIVWPVPICPAEVAVVPVNCGESEQRTAAERLYAELLGLGVEAVLDDRDERPGVKFKDADLIGFPWRITVGPKGLAQGAVEMRRRATGETELVPLGEAAGRVRAAVAA